MLKSDAERIIRRSIEETGAEFTEEQIAALSQMILKIAATMVEEALSTFKPSGPGSRPQFFA
ncbi:MAG: hypothetical protein K8F91_22450 [Candidatus Obscuribacterales bacterium]|nr:hypothetical protein [Candidatus Obscuribacterales bacterium]